MTKEELLEELLRLKNTEWIDWDPESLHVSADAFLIRYIGDVKITEAYNSIEKWYA